MDSHFSGRADSPPPVPLSPSAGGGGRLPAQGGYLFESVSGLIIFGVVLVGAMMLLNTILNS